MSPCTEHEVTTATTKSARTHKQQEMTRKQRYLNNALHDFSPSAHSVTSLHDGPQEMRQARKKENGGFTDS
jgi:hypothetical protein